MKRIVGIDARLFAQTGVGTYLRNLLHYLDQSTHTNDLLFYVYMLPADEKKILFKNKRFIKKSAPYHWHSLLEQTAFLKLLKSDNPDLMHFTYFSYPVLYNKPFIATVHDLTPLFFRTGKASTRSPLLYHVKFRAFSYILQQQISRASHIITPTKTVKQQILNHFGKALDDKVTSIYEGVDYELQTTKSNSKLSRQFAIPFIIYVGNFYPHKNVERLILAYSKVNTDCKLILIGPQDYFTERIVRYINLLELQKKILVYQVTTKEDLVFFYKNAQALVHPSLSEGFGLPLIETSYFGTPIIASDIPVFREVLKDHYTAFDPYDVESIAMALRKGLEVKKKPAPIFQYSFETMTQETLKIYTKVLDARL